jgi:hypothetical protein
MPSLKKKSPVNVTRDWLPANERRALWHALLSGFWNATTLRYGNARKRKNTVYYEGDSEAAHIYVVEASPEAVNKHEHKAIPYAKCPELAAVRKRLQEQYGFSLSLCYINFYEDKTVGIGWLSQNLTRPR